MTRTKIIILFCIAGAAIYFSVFENSLFWDADTDITNNVYVKNFDIVSIFSKSNSAGAGGNNSFYRPVSLLSFAIDYKIWGLENIAGFHFTGVTLHILSVILIYLIFCLLQVKKPIAIITGFLFLVHPLNSEVVSYISNRPDLLAVFFMLFSLYSFLKFKFGLNRSGYFISILGFIVALFSKETSIVFPALLLLVCLVFIETKIDQKSITRSFKTTLPFILSALGYLIVRFGILKITATFGDKDISFGQSIIAFLNVLVEYWKILIYPTDIRFRLDQFGSFSSFNLTTVVSIIILSAIVFFSIRSLFKSRLVFFCFSWFFITLSPATGIIMPINFALGERWLRFPALGLYFLAACGIYWAISKTEHRYKNYLYVPVMCYIVLLLGLQMIANPLWKNPINYFQYLSIYYPQDWRNEANLGIEYQKIGNEKLAFNSYVRASTLNGDELTARTNLAELYTNRKEYGKAIREYEKILKLDPNNTKVKKKLESLLNLPPSPSR